MKLFKRRKKDKLLKLVLEANGHKKKKKREGGGERCG